MEENQAPAPQPSEASLPLAGSQRLLVSTDGDTSTLRLVGGDGAVTLTVTITPAGHVLRFDGSALRLEASSDLTVAAQRISLRGEAGVAITTAGDLLLSAQGTLTTEAQHQSITALRGSEAGASGDAGREGGNEPE